MHLSGIFLLQNKNFKLITYINAVFKSLACLKNDKNNILKLLTYQNHYGKYENFKGSKYSTSVYMLFMYGAL